MHAGTALRTLCSCMQTLLCVHTVLYSVLATAEFPQCAVYKQAQSNVRQ
jgi:hypothetical protein